MFRLVSRHIGFGTIGPKNQEEEDSLAFLLFFVALPYVPSMDVPISSCFVFLFLTTTPYSVCCLFLGNQKNVYLEDVSDLGTIDFNMIDEIAENDKMEMDSGFQENEVLVAAIKGSSERAVLQGIGPILGNKKIRKILKNLYILLGHGQQARDIKEAVTKLMQRNYEEILTWDGKSKLVVFVPEFYLNKATEYVSPEDGPRLLRDCEDLTLAETNPERKKHLKSHQNKFLAGKRTWKGYGYSRNFLSCRGSLCMERRWKSVFDCILHR